MVMTSMTMNTATAGDFKAQCLAMMDDVEATGSEIVITKRGRPVAKLVAAQEPKRKLFGRMAGSLQVQGDLMAPFDVTWNAQED
ncbi:MAG: hypothetical protein RL318_3044 [Fibrobacterota bacterium]|jgi:prevent-host-death family protein